MHSINFLLEHHSFAKQRQATIIAITAMSLFVLYSIVFSQSLLLYLIALIIVGVVLFRYPKSLLPIIIVLTMWFERFFTLQLLELPGLALKLYPLDLLIALGICTVAYQLLTKHHRITLRRFDLPIILFVCLVGVVFLRSFFLETSIDLAFSTLKNYALYAIIYFLAIFTLPKQEDWKELTRWMLIASVGLFLFLLVGILRGSGIWSEYTPLSTSGVRLIAGTHTFYLTITLFAVVGISLWDKAKTPLLRLCNIIVPLLFTAAIIISLVRHLWVAGIVLLLIWACVLQKKQRKKLFGFLGRGALALSIVILLSGGVYWLVAGGLPTQVTEAVIVMRERLDVGSVLRLEDSSFGWRVATWQSALQMWRTEPIFGIGFGHMVSGAFQDYPFHIPVRDLHNDYMGILLQMGTIGLAFVLYWFGTLLVQLYNLWRKVRTSRNTFWKKHVFLWGNVVLLFMIVFSVSIYWDINLFIIWWWLALAGVRFALVEKHMITNV